MGKKAALFVVLAVVLASVAVMSTDVDADGPWTGGSGTQSDPYLISTESQLQYISATASNPNNYYLLINDITVTGEWMPIGSDGGSFNGTLDGNGYTIRGLTVTGDGDIGFVSNNQGTIRNLFFHSANVVATGYDVSAGTVVGINTGTIENCVVRSSEVTMDTTSEDVVASIYVGGIVGLNRGTVSMCEVSDTKIDVSHVSRDSKSTGNDVQHPEVQNNMRVGGIAGYSSNVVSDCLTDASINVYTQSRFIGVTQIVGGFEPTVTSYAGGIVGLSIGRVSDCAYVNNTAFTAEMEITGKNFWGTPSSQQYCDSGYGDICGSGSSEGCGSCSMNIGFLPETVYGSWDYTSNPNESDSAWYINNSVPHLVHPYLRVDKIPDKVQYTAGEEFSSAGMLVSVHNENGGSELVSPSRVNDEFSDDYSSISLVVQSGSRITYIEYAIEINPEFTVLSAPTKTTYYPGELFDPTGMQIGYRMSTTEPFQTYNDYVVTPSTIEADTTSVTVQCGTWSTTFQVSVVSPPSNVFAVDFVDSVTGNHTEYYPNGQVMTFKTASSGDRVFQGWNTAADGSGTMYAPGSTYIVNGNSTFYAIWESQDTGGSDDSGGWCSLTMVGAAIALVLAMVVPIAIIRW